MNVRSVAFKVPGLLVLAMLFHASASFATPGPISLQISNGATTWTVNDGDLGGVGHKVDVNPVDGAITFAGKVANWNLNVATGKGTPLLSIADLDLNSVDSSSTGSPGVLTILLSEKDVNEGIPLFDMGIGGTLTKASITYEAFYSTTNAYFQMTTLIGRVAPPSAGTCATCSNSSPLSAGFNQDLLNLATAGLIRSLTIRLTITPLGTSGTHYYSGDSYLTPVPEPATLVLLGSGLLAGAVARKRRQRTR